MYFLVKHLNLKEEECFRHLGRREKSPIRGKKKKNVAGIRFHYIHCGRQQCRVLREERMAPGIIQV